MHCILQHVAACSYVSLLVVGSIVYTMLLSGLPCTQIGQHFSRFGKVMDVVLVKDFGPLLNLASTATALEQQRRIAEERLARGHNAGEAACLAAALLCGSSGNSTKDRSASAGAAGAGAGVVANVHMFGLALCSVGQL
jgi:hypothetical protein